MKELEVTVVGEDGSTISAVVDEGDDGAQTLKSIELDDRANKQTSFRLTGSGPTITMGAPEINGVPINSCRKLTLICDPSVSPFPLLQIELDADTFDVDLLGNVEVVALYHSRENTV